MVKWIRNRSGRVTADSANSGGVRWHIQDGGDCACSIMLGSAGE